MRISGCVIVKNEEKNIEKCLSSLKKIADEVILVDTGSTDNTIEIAKKMGILVLEQEWEDDFSKPKNLAIEKATGDWIVSLDADEYFDEKSELKLRELLKKNHTNKNVEGILCELVNLDTNKNSIISNNNSLRIFRNQKKARFINKIHEEIRLDGRPLDCINLSSEITIIHTGYNELNREEKAKRNMEMMLKDPETGKNPYYLAISYYTINEYEEALKYSILSLTSEDIMSLDYLAYKIYLLIIKLLMILEPKNNKKIEKYIGIAVEKYGDHPEIAGIEGNYLLQQKRYKEALAKYLLSLEYQELYGKKYMQNDYPGLVSEIYFCIASIYSKMNNDDQAMEYYVKSLKVNKFYHLSFQGMLMLCKGFPEVVIISLINEIYNIEIEDELRFIIERISRIENPKVVLYYALRWNNVFGHEDDTLIYAFIAQKKYMQALEIAKVFLDQNKDIFAPVAAEIIILGGVFEEIQTIKSCLTEDLFNLLDSLRNDAVSEINSEAYLTVLALLANHAEEEKTKDYIKKGLGLETGTKSKIADMLLENEKFDYALEFYKDIYENFKGHYDKSTLFMRMGYCAYKLKNYEDGLNFFENAVFEGYIDNDLKEYLDWICELTNNNKIAEKARGLSDKYAKLLMDKPIKLNVGCGYNIKNGWINLDWMRLPGVDIVANLDECKTTKIPLEEDTVDEIYASHVIEHINNPVEMMEELYRIAKPDCKAIFRSPYGTSDDAYEDPTHVKQYFLNTYMEFSQPFYEKMDREYEGDWQPDKIVLYVEKEAYEGKPRDEVLRDVMELRNVVTEMVCYMHAVKPKRDRKKALFAEPEIEFDFN